VSRTFALPLILDGAEVEALVVGGGAVATRKTLALLDGGAVVRVRAPRVSEELVRHQGNGDRLRIECSVYDEASIGDATLIVAATDDADVNARVAADARRARRLVLVANDPPAGNCVMPAVHRSGELLVAVTSGGIPRASARVRDSLARRLDNRYASAIRELGRLRQQLLARGDRAAWHSAAKTLLADDFCESVESGAFSERIAAWQ
jgi:precorrin-2 dehydrogenase/sirohydrochlorin ferrochelatase